MVGAVGAVVVVEGLNVEAMEATLLEVGVERVL